MALPGYSQPAARSPACSTVWFVELIAPLCLEGRWIWNGHDTTICRRVRLGIQQVRQNPGIGCAQFPDLSMGISYLSLRQVQDIRKPGLYSGAVVINFT